MSAPVFDYDREDALGHYYLLLHGKIVHGLQFTDPIRARWPTTYYAETSGVGRAISSLPRGRPRRLGLVGLGTGTLAAYARSRDFLRIYEINPQVEALARTRFTYVPLSPARIRIVPGDARLSMERELARGEPQGFDLLALDAFNSDAIPVHLITEQAFAVYLRHLQPDGILAVHISNKYFDLEPVVDRLAGRFGLASVTVEDDAGEDQWWIYDSDWMLLSRNPRVLQVPGIAQAAVPSVGGADAPLWTDDYTSLFQVLR